MDVCQVDFEPQKDEHTGREFTLLSVGDDHLVLPYFHRECWSCENEWIVCECRNLNLTCLCNWTEKRTEVLNLAWGGDVSNACYARTSDAIWFARGKAIWRGRLGGTAEQVHSVETDGEIAEISPNGSDTGMAMMLTVNGILKRLVYLDFSSGKETVCCEGNRWLSHLQMCPTRDDLILFCDGQDPRDWHRMYTVLNNGRQHFPFYTQKKGEWVTHECWTRN